MTSALQNIRLARESVMRGFSTVAALPRKKTARASLWMASTYFGSQGLRLISNLVLTRLLAPEVFGLMAIANAISLGLSFFSDVGIFRSIIQNPRGERPAFYNTAWTIQVLRGGCLWLLTCVVAVPVANWYGEPRLAGIIPTVGFMAVITGFASTALITLNRRMQVAKLAIFDLCAQSVSIVLMIVLVSVNRSVWSLIAGMLISEVLRVAASHWLVPGYRNRPHWDKKSAREIGEFGKWILFATAMTFLAGQSDRLILSKEFTLTFVGIYTVAFTIAEVPRQVLSKLNQTVLLPTICQQLHLERPKLKEYISHKRKFLLAVSAVGLAVLTVFGDYAILILFDSRYHGGAWMIPVLAVGLWVPALALSSDPALYALGKPRIVALGNLAKFVFLVVAVPIASRSYGAVGAIVALAAKDLPYYVAVIIGLKREKLQNLNQDLIFTSIVVIVIMIFLAIRFVLGFDTPLMTLGSPEYAPLD